MFGSIDKSKGLLFVTYDLGQLLQNTQQKMREEIEGLDGNRLLNTPVTDLVTYFVEKHKIEPITLLKESWYADTKEVRVDVRYDPMRWIDDKSKPALVAGERTEVRIPSEGESELFYSRSNTYNMNPPRAAIQGNELILRYEMPSDAPRDIRPPRRPGHGRYRTAYRLATIHDRRPSVSGGILGVRFRRCGRYP